jgi:hypothetical protein
MRLFQVSPDPFGGLLHFSALLFAVDYKVFFPFLHMPVHVKVGGGCGLIGAYRLLVQPDASGKDEQQILLRRL